MNPYLTVTLIAILSLVILANVTGTDWRNAPRDSAQIAPLPEVEPQAVVQIYAARAINWRGWFAVHTWVATKEKNAKTYTVYHVMGWQLRRTGESRMIKTDIPDRFWFGAKPTLVDSLIGEKAESAIPKIKAAADSYGYPNAYRVWPELGVELPAHAIGKDGIGKGDFFARSESGTGYQFSLFGLLGMTVGKAEGIEINLLGLTFGVDFLRPALKLPLIGRLGMADAPVS